MHQFFLKMFFISTFFFFLFLFCRISDLIRTSFDLTRKFIQPAGFEPKLLKSILDQRGISYEGVFEKSELVRLVNSSGDVSAEELELVPDQPALFESTAFSSGIYFNEVVEDCKDSVWLVNVVADRKNAFMVQESWTKVGQHLSRFEIRRGEFDCYRDHSFCRHKHWTSSRLVLGIPDSNKMKSNVVLFNYHKSSRVPAVLDWIREELGTQLHVVTSDDELRKEWLEKPIDFLQPEVRLVMLANEQMATPLFLSSLSVKFNGRLKIAIFRSSNVSVAEYMVKTRERTIHYGGGKGEALTYLSLKRFLTWLYPEVDRAIVLNLELFTLMAVLDFLLAKGRLLMRFYQGVVRFVSYMTMTILVWLFVILPVLQTRLGDVVSKSCLWLLRHFALSDVGCLVRRDVLWYFPEWWMRVAVLLVVGVVVRWIIASTRNGEDDRQDEEELTDWQSIFREAGPPVIYWPQEPSFILGPRIWPTDDIAEQEADLSHLPQWRFAWNQQVRVDPLDNHPHVESVANFPAGVLLSEGCPICFEQYQPDVFLCSLCCGHAFHMDCLREWLKKGTMCPLCRTPAP